MRTVLFDVDTQLDFLYPAGALSVPNGAELVPRLQILTQLAVDRKWNLISTTDAHTENDPEFQHWPPHCVLGTLGQRKAAMTLLSQNVTLPSCTVEPDVLRQAASAPQIMLQKQTMDSFTNANLRPLLAALQADRYIVYGVVAEICVARALFGLLQSGLPVQLIVDGTKAIDESEFGNVLAHFQAAGGRLTNVSELAASA